MSASKVAKVILNDSKIELPKNVYTNLEDLPSLSNKNGVRVLDIFCGMGGMSIGFEKAGFESVLGIDASEQAIATFALNRPKSSGLLTNIGKLDATKLAKKTGHIDLVIGGVPCETFSGINTLGDGSHTKKHARKLIYKAVEIVEAVKAKMFCFENVRQALDSPQWKRAISYLRKHGWCVESCVLDASEYGASTKRNRLFLIGTKAKEFDLNLIKKVRGKLPSQVISGLSKKKDPLHLAYAEMSDLIRRQYKLTPMTRTKVQTSRKDSYGNFVPDVSTGILRENKYAPTILTSTKIIHTNGKRYLTAREIARIQGVPDSYRYSVSNLRKIVFMIGDSVPPPMATQVAKAIKEHLAKTKVAKVLPKPKPGESKDKFTQRFMRHSEALTEFPRNDQRYAVAISAWNSYHKKNEPGSEADDADQSQPAAPDERRRGSRANEPGSASTEGGRIALGEATNKALRRKLEAHHEKVGDDKTKRTTLRALQAVYRRGAGAFSVSHRPGMTRAQWAMARVNHFLHLLETGKPKDAKYITDNDLLPEGHPAIVEKQESFKPPKAVRDAAARGLALRREWGRGGLSVQQAAEQGLGSGVQRAVNLKNGDNITLETVGRMRSFFARHQVNNRPNKKMPDGGPTAGTIAWLLWGGDPGKKWADEIWSKHKMKKAFSCPIATQDLEVNTLNRNNAIEADHIKYGPLNLTDENYWKELAAFWNTDVETAKNSKCNNCAAFDVSPQMKECMPGSIQEDGELGYCHMHAFKCHSERSCRTWAAGGPIKDNDVSASWIDKGFIQKNNVDISWEIPLCKVDDEERIVTGIVLEPNTVDAQGDIVSPDTIKEAAYSFLKRYNKKTQLGVMHKMFGDLGISLVESWIAKSDHTMNDKHIKKGSWLMSIRIDDNEKLWEKCKRGEITGFSIGGTAKVS